MTNAPPVFASQTLTVPSLLAEARRRPSGLKATHQTAALWPLRMRGTAPDILSSEVPFCQAVSAGGVTQWDWDITPKQLGRQRLHLTLDAIVKIDNHESTYTLQTFDKTIGVNVVWPETLISFLGKYWQWVCTAVVFPIVAWLAKRIFKG